MKLAIVTDAWQPQVNGVVTTLSRTRDALQRAGHDVTVVAPEAFRTVPCPTYPEIRLALLPGRKLAATLDALAPDADPRRDRGPARGRPRARYCVANGLAFTTSYHTQFPQYVRKRVPIPESGPTRICGTITVARAARWSRRSTSGAISSRTASTNVVLWSRGVDAELFKPSRP